MHISDNWKVICCFHLFKDLSKDKFVQEYQHIIARAKLDTHHTDIDIKPDRTKVGELPLALELEEIKGLANFY